MLNIAKWELIKRTSWLNIIFPIYIGLLLVVVFMAETGLFESYNNNFVLRNTIYIPLLCLVGYIMILMPTLSMITDLRSKSLVLEKMRTVPFLSTAVIRIIINVLQVSLAWGLLLLATKISNVLYDELLGIGLSNVARLLFYSAIVSPVLAMFTFIAGLSLRKWSAFSLFFSFILYFMIGWACLFIEFKYPTPSFAIFVIMCISVAVLLIAASWLYDNTCEIAEV